MGRVHPQTQISSYSTTSSSTQESFTIWMKSLVLGGKGCTVFDSEGQLVYRVDNYNHTSTDEVYLMDINGNILYNIMKKKYSLAGCWGVLSFNDREIISQHNGEFQVRKSWCFLRGNSSCEVYMGLDRNQTFLYKIESQKNEFACKIVDKLERVIAEVKRKQSMHGVVFDQDVLSLVVEPCVDHSLVMALLVAFALLNRRI